MTEIPGHERRPLRLQQQLQLAAEAKVTRGFAGPGQAAHLGRHPLGAGQHVQV